MDCYKCQSNCKKFIIPTGTFSIIVCFSTEYDRDCSKPECATSGSDDDWNIDMSDRVDTDDDDKEEEEEPQDKNEWMKKTHTYLHLPIIM